MLNQQIEESITDERRFNAALRVFVLSYASWLLRRESQKEKVNSPLDLKKMIVQLMLHRRDHLRESGAHSVARSVAAAEIDRLIAQIRAIRVDGDPS